MAPEANAPVLGIVAAAWIGKIDSHTGQSIPV
jgi:hypothetical protein